MHPHHLHPLQNQLSSPPMPNTILDPMTEHP
jgi:hypothetical protein